ncbi:MAG: FHA domain-containing protein, partial [Armatimonadota bacterium]|nr:FHA domain-containing protein [Armatimonadota bacterium]
AGSQIGTLLNGQKVTQGVLKDCDVIEIGSMRLEFHEKATASKIPRQVDVSEKPLSESIPQVPGICPFCGGRKDPNTGLCDCSVGVAPLSRQAPERSDTGPRLVGISGPYAGQSYTLSSDAPTTIGREPGRSIQLPMDTTVSRRHARIVNEGGTFVVYDEGSSNGTVVNGRKITRIELAPGDIVAFGASQFRFEQ